MRRYPGTLRRNEHTPGHACLLTDKHVQARNTAAELSERTMLSLGWAFSQPPEGAPETTVHIPATGLSHATPGVPANTPAQLPATVAGGGGKAARWAAKVGARGACASAATEEEEGGHIALVYAREVDGEVKWSGWTRGGVLEGRGSVLWGDGHEYHGEMAQGSAHGEGVHVLPDGSKLSCSFANGCPAGSGSLADARGRYWDVVYSGDVAVRAGAAAVSSSATVEPVMRSYYRQYGGSVECRCPWGCVRVCACMLACSRTACLRTDMCACADSDAHKGT